MKSILEAELRKAPKRLLEKDLQRKCVDWYRTRAPGNWARKFSSQSQRSVPDYLFSCAEGFKFACEFKRPGCPIRSDTGCMSTPAQVEEQDAMREAGWFVFECSDFDKFKETVLLYSR